MLTLFGNCCSACDCGVNFGWVMFAVAIGVIAGFIMGKIAEG